MYIIAREQKKKFTEYIKQIARQSLIDEVSTTPKPGLVDLKDSGAHKDMDYHTFLASTEAIVPFIATMAGLGTSRITDHACEQSYGNIEELFRALRPVGIAAEKAMSEATHGVNTHKGAIFSMGLVAAAAGYSLAAESFSSDNFSDPASSSPSYRLSAEKILRLCRLMCAGAVEEDFARINAENPATHGERLYLQYGVRGIRGEAADGFPSIASFSLPVLRKLTQHRFSDDLTQNWNSICLQVLLHLMAEVDDTNVLYRTDYESLQYVREQARRILSSGGAFSDSGYQALEKLNEDFIRKNISPGGCADLLAITLFLWRLEQFSFPVPPLP